VSASVPVSASTPFKYLPGTDIAYTPIKINDALLAPVLFGLSTTQSSQPTSAATQMDIRYGTSEDTPQQQQPEKSEEQNIFAGDLQTFFENPQNNLFGYAAGGQISHPMGEPEFYSQGGLGNLYIEGRGDGTSDSIPAMVAANEYVIPADIVSNLGNGSSDAGASVLDRFVQEIRKHKRSTPVNELPPDSKGPLEYLSYALKGRK